MISVKVTKIWLFVKDKKRKNTHHNKNYTCKRYGQKGRNYVVNIYRYMRNRYLRRE